ncbi:MAG: UDP-N-acetylmuramate--L-alanine ligase [Cyanobacteria bacterium HKST-UBA06]|nr:UDP-N-acetylmuramate--L-alanine ligase [Cyanobacteria bacterium HKST-UBA06]
MMLLSPGQAVYFIGIGGVGMSGLARILKGLGYDVGGSDTAASAYTAQLEALGIAVDIGPQTPDQLPAGSADTLAVVQSTAIGDDHQQVAAARGRGLPVYHRSDVLQTIMAAHQTTIGISGTHGKTSVTGMVGQLLIDCGRQPTVVAGGKLPQLGTNACHGPSQQVAVAELDESDGTVVKYNPTYTVLTNLELDHPDHYTDGVTQLLETFTTFLTGLDAGSGVLVNAGCPLTQRLLDAIKDRVAARLVFVALDKADANGADYWLDQMVERPDGTFAAELHSRRGEVVSLALSTPGRAMVWNAAFAAAIGLELECLPASIADSLNRFTGMGRRFEVLGEYNGALVVDDYAHHPTELQVTLSAARQRQRYHATTRKEACGEGRLIVLLQPHRYMRVHTLWQDYLTIFGEADVVVVLDIYAAGEAPIEGVTGQRLAEAISQFHHTVFYWPSTEAQDWQRILAQLKAPGFLNPGDCLVTMGAGTVTQVGRQLVEAS